MGLLERMERLETPKASKKAPRKVSASAKGTQKPQDENLKKFAKVLKQPDTLAKAKEKSGSSLHTHLNKVDEHGVSHKDRIEEELRLQVKKIKKIATIFIVASFIVIVSIILLVKLVGSVTNDSAKSTTTTQSSRKKKISFARLKHWSYKYVKSSSFNQAKLDKIFADFDAQASENDRKSSAKLRTKLKKLYNK